ncbi:MAG TPA: hypothetical protein VGE98_04125, partial [Thermoanaerobaculia bacterium]
MRRPCEEFQLRIERASERYYRATVVRSPGGGVAATRFRLDPDTLFADRFRQMHLASPPAEEAAKQIGR